MINIISAIGSIGTFIMALFYFVSVSVQLYQMKISFLPALGFNQILLEREGDQLNIMNSATEEHHHKDYIKLYNLGGGAAKKIAIEVLLGNDKVIQKKYVNILPSKEGYMLSIVDLSI
ncbi:membrane protein [Staphylococcus aureus]|nr:membrane protein [Staphylococcus aureus]